MAAWDIDAKNLTKSEEELHQVTLQLSWLHQFQFAGYYAAAKKGFYQDAGFQVAIKQGRPGIKPVEEIVSGRANYAAGRVPVLLHRLHGKPVVVLASIFQHTATIFLAKRESGIYTPPDMIGRRVMMLKGDDSAEYLAMFRKEGVPLEQISILPSSNDIDDLINGKTDVINAYSTNEPHYLETQKIPVSIIDPKTYGIDFYGDCLFTSEQELKQHPDQVKAFSKASLKGWQYAMVHPEEIIELILTAYGAKKTREHLIFEAHAVRDLILPDLIKIGHMNPGRWRHIADTYVKLGMAEPGFSLEGFIYNPNPMPSRASSQWVVGLTVFLSLLIGLISIVLLLFNRRLHVEIRQRKHAQRTLRESEQRANQYLDIAGVIIIALDTNGKITLINEYGLKVLGYRREELLGKNWFATCLPDRSREKVVAVYRQLMRDEIKPVEFYENQILRKDGKERIISWHNAVFRNSSGEITGTLSSGEDITERKRAEKALRESEEKYRGIFENAVEGFFQSTPEGRFISVNPSFARMLGYSSPENLISSITDIAEQYYVNAEDRRRYQKILEKEGSVEHFEFEALCKDGSQIWVSNSTRAIYDQNGKIIRYEGNVNDITLRKQTEEALRESEKKYRTTFESSPDSFTITRVKDGRYLDVNKGFCQITGYTSEEVIGKTPFDLNLIVNQAERDEFVRKLKEEGEVSGFELQYRMKDGTVFDTLLSARPLRYGGQDCLLAVVKDITLIKRTEEALRESETKYRSMMEAMKDLIYICSPDYRVEYMNPAMIKKIGRDATGEHCFKALHDLDEKCPWCVCNMVQQDQCVESDIVSPKNNRSYHVSHSPIIHQNGSISKMTVYRDTTDFKKMETQLRQAQKMEAIGTLAGGIAHDFNNILFPMFGYLEMMLEDVKQSHPMHDHLTEVFNGAKRARDLVKQILTFSRQKDLEMKPLKVQSAIKEALKLIKSSLPSTIEISENIQNQCGLVLADPTQIHQIAMNLCTNAYHAIEETGGKLFVSLKEVEFALKDLKGPAIPGMYACLTVADTGPGMEQRVIDRIFDPYFTTKEKGKGTGLGLAVVDGIVKSHGGRISVYSEPGKGTEFKIYLPLIQHRKKAQKTTTDTPIRKGSERVLLVDDQERIVDMERQMLERLGYHVTTRTSSTDALEAFRMQPDKFDVVITDMTMPNMTGDKLAVELIRIRSDIPVILCTGFSEIMSKERAAALGIKGFLMKPIVIKDLSNIIRDVLDHN